MSEQQQQPQQQREPTAQELRRHNVFIGFETSENTDKLDVALALAQGKIQSAKKDRKNPYYDSSYATLDSVYEACRVALSEAKIAVTQWPVTDLRNGVVHIITRVAHEGQWIRGTLAVPVAKGDAQGLGSAITYGKRYGLSAAVGVVAEEDDDGNAAADGYKHQQRHEQENRQQQQQQGQRGGQKTARKPSMKLEEALAKFDEAKTSPAVEDVAKLLRGYDWTAAEITTIKGSKGARLEAIAKLPCPECSLKDGEHAKGCPVFEQIERMEKEAAAKEAAAKAKKDGGKKEERQPGEEG